jgi:hypothetical protein
MIMSYHLKNKRRRMLGRRLSWSHEEWELERQVAAARRWETVLAIGGAVLWLALIALIGGALWRS